MKKFILVMVFVLLIALFVAFNYLLWDRESKVAEIKNLISVNTSNDASISAQKREISTLEDEVSGLENQLEQYERDKEALRKEYDTASAELKLSQDNLRDRIDFINILKENTDTEILSKPIISWAEALSQGNLEDAYNMEYATVPTKDRPVKLSTYIDQMTSSVSRVEITDVKLDRLRGYGNGEIYIFVKFDVKLVENVDLSGVQYSEGENEMYVKIDYSKEKKDFVIASIILI
jgi:cell division protein FtsB